MKAIYNEDNFVKAFGQNIAPGNDFCEVANPEVIDGEIIFQRCFRYSIDPGTGVVIKRTVPEIKATQEWKDKREDEIDDETSSLIKQHCKGNKKNEEYYLRQGIKNGATDTEFVAYNTEVENIKTSQHQKKIDEGVITE